MSREDDLKKEIADIYVKLEACKCLTIKEKNVLIEFIRDRAHQEERERIKGEVIKFHKFNGCYYDKPDRNKESVCAYCEWIEQVFK